MTHLPPFPALFELPSKSSQIITFIQKSNKPKQQWHIWLINLATFFWKTKKKKRKEEDLLIETNYAIQKKHKNPSRTHKTRKKEHIAASRILVPFYSWKKNTGKAIFAWNTWQHSTVWLKHKKGELPDGKSSVAL